MTEGQSTLVFAQNDRAANYGDGCFTTIALLSGNLQLIDLHLLRLKQDCQRLAIPFIQFDTLKTELDNVIAAHKTGRHVVKILISRGEGGRGYSPVGCEQPRFLISVHPYPKHYDNWQTQGISLGVAALKLARQPLLAGIKHLNRLEQVLIKQELLSRDCDDLLVLDSNNNVIESSAANVFWYAKDSGWYTPDVAQAGVAGVMREAIISYMQAQKIELTRDSKPIQSVMTADAVFICNCLIGIVPVVRLQISHEDKVFKPEVINEFISEFRNWVLKK